MDEIKMLVTLVKADGRWMALATVTASKDDRVKVGAQRDEWAKSAYGAVDKVMYDLLKEVR